MRFMSSVLRRAGIAVAAVAVVYMCWSLLRGTRAVRPHRAAGTEATAGDDTASPPAGSPGDDGPTPGEGRPGATAPASGADADELDDDVPPPIKARDPHWLIKFFAPHPGENLLDYRDRVLPVVQAAAAPHRARVKRWRDEFADEANLSSEQRQLLDTAVRDAADAIGDRVFQAVFTGEILPPRLKPSVGVAFARDLLDQMDRANQRFTDSLDPEQRDRLASSRFDVIDYLVFSTRWEDMLGVTE